ncbi:MAG: hypothetical protein ACK5Y5_06975 [Gemmatimonas sp.]|jgi:hypothetical protein|uniref:hypothetical protein n=1 Tax=Gemmatimonas sp. TaxID=1962908 RepID=UPI00391FC479
MRAHLVIALFISSCFSALAYAEALQCRYVSGELLFKSNDLIQVVRAKKLVTIRSGNDAWTYSIVAEDASLGYRAIRSSVKPAKHSGIDVLLGGEVFMVKDAGVKKLFVTASNAATASSESASYACSN